MSWNDDPNVKAALKERSPSDVMLLCCPACGDYSYYNEGSHFTCYFCGAGYYVATEDEGGFPGPFVAVEDAITVEDALEVPEDEWS